MLRSPLPFRPMPRGWSHEARESRRQRAHERGYLKPLPDDDFSYMAVRKDLKPALKLMHKSLLMHKDHDLLLGQAHHHGRNATRAAHKHNLIDDDLAQDGMKAHKLAGKAKHTVSLSATSLCSSSESSTSATSSQSSAFSECTQRIITSGLAPSLPQFCRPPLPPEVFDIGEFAVDVACQTESNMQNTVMFSDPFLVARLAEQQVNHMLDSAALSATTKLNEIRLELLVDGWSTSPADLGHRLEASTSWGQSAWSRDRMEEEMYNLRLLARAINRDLHFLELVDGFTDDEFDIWSRAGHPAVVWTTWTADGVHALEFPDPGEFLTEFDDVDGTWRVMPHLESMSSFLSGHPEAKTPSTS